MRIILKYISAGLVFFLISSLPSFIVADEVNYDERAPAQVPDLMVAFIRSKQSDELKKLLDQGVNPNPFGDQKGGQFSTVTWAVICNEPKILGMLLDHEQSPT